MSEQTTLALEILERTNDGNDLAPEHLKLLENAVNGFLNRKGIEMFAEVHRQVVSGQYRKPWLHDIEHLTRDHEGYVYWKGHHVEHWNSCLVHSEEGRRQGLELARRCMIIEERGEVPDVGKTVWFWPSDEETYTDQ